MYNKVSAVPQCKRCRKGYLVRRVVEGGQAWCCTVCKFQGKPTSNTGTSETVPIDKTALFGKGRGKANV